MISRSTAGVLSWPRWSFIAPILALASPAGAADSPDPLVPASLIYRLVIAAVLAAVFVVVLCRTRFWRVPGLKSSLPIGPVHPIAWFLAAIGLYLLVQGFAGMLIGVVGPVGADDAVGRSAGSVLAFYPAAALLSVGTVVGLRHFDRGEALPVPYRGLLVGMLTFLAAVPIFILAADLAILVHVAATGARPAPIAHQTLQMLLENRSDGRTVIVLIGAVLGAPIFEETVYRGLLQTALVRALVSRTAGVLATAALFALSHRTAGTPVPWHALAPILVVGVFCGFLREHPKAGLTGAFAFHASFNLANVAIAWLVLGD